MQNHSSIRLSRFLIYSSLLMGIFTLSHEIPPFYPTIAAVLVVAGLIMDEREWYPLPNRLITLLVVAGVILHLYGMRLQILFERIAQIMMILIAAKAVSTKGVRDYLQLSLLSMLLMASAAVGQWGISFGVLLSLHASILLMGLLFLYASTEKRTLSAVEVRSLTLWGLSISGLLLPVSLLFFFLLPRPDIGFTPGWVGGRVAARTGFGETVSPGAVETIKRDTSVAFRAEFLHRDKPIPPNRLYWRGRVYRSYRHGRWFGRETNIRKGSFMPVSGEIIQYRVFLEPYDGNTLFTLGLPVKARSSKGKVYLETGYTLRFHQPMDERISYTVTSVIGDALPPYLNPSLFLKLPKKVKRALLPISRTIAPKEHDPLRLALSVEEYLRKNHGYTLNPGYRGRYPVVNFLLKDLPGHCEYFASAMAILLRIRGVPARLVGGFLGGQWNPLGHYYIVKNSDAHTWVEVWVPERGWVTFDPTPPSNSAPADSYGRLQRALDYLRFQWYHWIINYDYQRQVSLIQRGLALFSAPGKRRTERKIPLRTMGIIFGMVLTALTILYLCHLWLHRPKGWGDRLDHALKKRGIVRLPGETLLEVADRLKGENRELAEKVEAAVLLYYQLEFGKRDVAITELKRLVEQIKR